MSAEAQVRGAASSREHCEPRMQQGRDRPGLDAILTTAGACFPPSKRHCHTGLHSARLGCTAPGKPYKAAAVSQPRRPPLKEPGAHSPCPASDASRCSPHPRLRNRQPGRKPRNNSPPFGYPELKYGGKGATVHYPCPSLVSSGE